MAVSIHSYDVGGWGLSESCFPFNHPTPAAEIADIHSLRTDSSGCVISSFTLHYRCNLLGARPLFTARKKEH
jgi:hypothetical protein